MLLPPKLANAIITLVSLVWVTNYGAQFFVTDWHPDIAINGIFMAVVGTAFGLSRKRGKPDHADGEGDGAEPGGAASGVIAGIAQVVLDRADPTARHRPPSRPRPAQPRAAAPDTEEVAADE